jgi:hypothetical protein
MARPSLSVVKTLFALSGNICAFQDEREACEQHLTNPAWKEVIADIAHIAGERPGSARFDPSMTDIERHSYENLMLLCPTHHRTIDRLGPDDLNRHMVIAIGRVVHLPTCIVVKDPMTASP